MKELCSTLYRYQEYAEKNNIEVAKFYRTKKFIEYKGTVLVLSLEHVKTYNIMYMYNLRVK